jgi:hypothetical protein
MDENCWQDVAYKLHFPVRFNLNYFWSLGIWAFSRATNLGCFAPGHINLAYPHIFFSTMVEAI